MAKKNKKKGGFAIMDFLIVGGIAAVAYFLFSSFKKAGPIITPTVVDPNTTINPAGGGGGSGAGGAGVNPAEYYFTGSERAQQLLRGNHSTNPINSVKAVQVFLTKSGHSTQGIDGIFGDNTEDAIDAYFSTSRLLPTPVTLDELGIYAINFSNNRIFGNDTKASVISKYIPKEYINKTTGWVYNDDSGIAGEFFKV